MVHLGIFDVLMTPVAWFDPDMVALEWALGGEDSPIVGVLIQHHMGLGMVF